MLEDFHPDTSGWMYAKSFATLESDLAKGIKRDEKWNHNVRWKRWVRKRSANAAGQEIVSGWLGSKERRGTWKSRYFILIGDGLGGVCNQENDNDEDDSSNDEGDADDEEPIEPCERANELLQQDNTNSPAAPGGGNNNGPLEYAPPVMLYLRRGFTDPRAAFPLTFDVNELRRLPKKQIRVLKLSNRCKIDDSLASSDSPGRFAVRLPSGRKRVLNAANAETRERWVDALRSLLEFDEPSDQTGTSPSKRQNRLVVAFRAAKRGQMELRKNLGLATKKSSSSSSYPSASHLGQHFSASPMAHSVVSSSMPHHMTLSSTAAAPSHTMMTFDLIRNEINGALNVRLTEATNGAGLVIESVYENCATIAGHRPVGMTPGDIVVSVNGESLLGMFGERGTAMQRLKMQVAKVPKGGVVSLTVAVSSPSSPTMTALASATPFKKMAHASSVGNESTASSTMAYHKGSPVLSSSEASEGSPKASRLHANSYPAEGNDMDFDDVFVSTNEEEFLLNKNSSVGSMNANDLSDVVSPLQRAIAPREVPINAFGITTSHAESTTVKIVDRLTQNDKVATYASIRAQVAAALHADGVFDAIEWRVWFRTCLDRLCDGSVYATGAIDLTDFSPLIYRV